MLVFLFFSSHSCQVISKQKEATYNTAIFFLIILDHTRLFYIFSGHCTLCGFARGVAWRRGRGRRGARAASRRGVVASWWCGVVWVASWFCVLCGCFFFRLLKFPVRRAAVPYLYHTRVQEMRGGVPCRAAVPCRVLTKLYHFGRLSTSSSSLLTRSHTLTSHLTPQPKLQGDKSKVVDAYLCNDVWCGLVVVFVLCCGCGGWRLV